MTEKISWITPGDQVVDFTLPEYLYKSKEGFANFPTSLETVKGINQDGETLIGQNLEPRDLSITLVINGETREELLARRRNIIRMFSSKQGKGRLRWTRGDGIYEIKAICNGELDFPNTGGKSHQIAIINLLAPDPRWFDPNVNAKVVNESSIINNKGDIITPVKIIVDGPASNPIEIENQTTGDKITVNTNLSSGSRLIINSKFGAKEVSVNGNNYFYTISADSNFPFLAPGDNKIITSTEMELKFYDRFLGI